MRRRALCVLAWALAAALTTGAAVAQDEQFLRDPEFEEPGAPTPRDRNGKVMLGTEAGETGLWLPTVNTQYPLAPPETNTAAPSRSA